MKAVRTVNTAISLVVLGWLSCAWGTLSQLGDPAPWVTKAELEAHRKVALAFMLFGVLSVFGSLWLAGCNFSTAPKRATLVALLAVVPTIALFFVVFHF
jgi:hypothetical protein